MEKIAHKTKKGRARMKNEFVLDGVPKTDILTGFLSKEMHEGLYRINRKNRK